MDHFDLYRGLWPGNVSRMAKYAVRFDKGIWKVTVWCDFGGGLEYRAVENDETEIAKKVNRVKQVVSGQPGGVFYVNEYGHLLVPTSSGDGTHYYFAGKVNVNFRFRYDEGVLTSRPEDNEGNLLQVGEHWTGPRPGIPYILAAGGNDIYFKSQVLTDSDPPRIREGFIQRVQLSKVLRDRSAAAKAARPIASIRGQSGGRFYVNEHRAIFTPVDQGDEDGLRYIYCGQIELSNWFPEPPIGEPPSNRNPE